MCWSTLMRHVIQRAPLVCVACVIQRREGASVGGQGRPGPKTSKLMKQMDFGHLLYFFFNSFDFLLRKQFLFFHLYRDVYWRFNSPPPFPPPPPPPCGGHVTHILQALNSQLRYIVMYKMITLYILCTISCTFLCTFSCTFCMVVL